MDDIDDIVTHAPGAVFAVDQDQKILAWNQDAEVATGRLRAQALGRRCYEVVPAFDVETGLPCYEACPLVKPSLRTGWVHSRVLETRPTEDQSFQLDCMLVDYVLPTQEAGAMSVLTPLSTDDAREQIRVTATLEALYPLMVSGCAPDEALPQILRVLLDATATDTAEIALLDPHRGEPTAVHRETALGESSCIAANEAIRSDLRALASRSEGALITVRQANDPSGPSWHLTAPICDERGLLGALMVSSQRAGFSFGHAARILFTVAGQISVFLRWMTLVDSRWNELIVGQPMSRPTPVTPELRLYCLGQFRVVRSRNGLEREIGAADFRRPQKSLSLLKILAAHRGRPISRESLIDYLWPEADPVLALNNLRVVLHELRHALEPDLARGQASTFIVSLGDQLYLDPSGRCWVDLEDFERLARDADDLAEVGQTEEALFTAQAAIALYRADYLVEDPYSDWCLPERERLREIYLGLLHRQAELQAESGDLAAAILTCRQALAADPIREQTHRQLITILGQAGRRDEAVRQYDVCRRLLWQELGVDPDESTQLIYRRLLPALGGAARA